MGGGGVRKGWGDGLLRRLPVVLAALKRDTKAGVRTAVLATAPPGNPIWPLSALRFQNPSLIYKLPPNFVQLNGARCLRGWGPHGTSPPDTGFLQFELQVPSCPLLLPKSIHSSRSRRVPLREMSPLRKKWGWDHSAPGDWGMRASPPPLD